MAKLSGDGKYVTVEKGDTLSEIARDYGKGKTYKQLAAINNISNPNLIHIGQKIYLSSSESGGGSSTSSTKKVATNKAKIKQFGLMAGADRTLFATWDWNSKTMAKPNPELESTVKKTDTTENYKIQWQYYTNKHWFTDTDGTTEYKESTYSIPDNAKYVRFRVKPISKKKKDNKKETSYWTANWTDWEKFDVDAIPPTVPDIPSVTTSKLKLTAELTGINSDTEKIIFQIVNGKTGKTYKTSSAVSVKSAKVSWSCTLVAGDTYDVRCRAVRDDLQSDWSAYSYGHDTPPAASKGIKKITAKTETSVYIDWYDVSNAKSYEIEWTTKKDYFDRSTEVSSVSVAPSDPSLAPPGNFLITGLESGQEYFFRVRAVNNANNEVNTSAWTEIKSIVIGKAPVAPTTWSSTTTVISGESLKLYWVHNTIDGSSQTYAKLKLTINGETTITTIKNSTDEDEKDKTSVYTIDTTQYTEGTKIYWQVQTKGIINTGGPNNDGYSEWSIQRTVDIYAPPTLELSVVDKDDDITDTIESFPFYISGLAGPNTQIPIGYHVNIIANESYETVDDIGNVKMVSEGDPIYNKYFDTNDPLLIELSANNIDLENGVSYTVKCIVSMNSGLTAEASTSFYISWTDEEYVPNAEISIDEETWTAAIRPYCEDITLTYHKVIFANGKYTVAEELTSAAFGDEVPSAYTDTGEQVYFGDSEDETNIYYCEVETSSLVENVRLSVYRREFDGTFTEVATDLTNYTCIIDPHPSLDYARYRIVATTVDTGAISFYDVPGVPVNCMSAVIQWDEEWTEFDVSNEDELSQPPWTGSLLAIPYNIDVSDSHDNDVELAKYIGRTQPVAYYGTQRGESATWNMVIPKDDKDTLYALRRLAIWMGDVYVREPSGSGYWASISVSFSQKHNELTIPVALSITRIEGGA